MFRKLFMNELVSITLDFFLDDIYSKGKIVDFYSCTFEELKRGVNGRCNKNVTDDELWVVLYHLIDFNIIYKESEGVDSFGFSLVWFSLLQLLDCMIYDMLRKE